MIAPLRERLESMTFREKIDYLWDYYKIHLFVIIAVIFGVIYIINTAIGSKEPVLNVVFIGDAVNTMPLEDLSETFNQELLSEEVREDSQISLQFVNLASGGAQQSMAETQKFTTLLAAGAYDVMISEQETYQSLKNQGALADLEKVANLGEIDTGGHEVIYSDTGQPIAISVSEMEVLDEVISIENAYLYVPNNAENRQYIQPLIEYLTGF